MFTQGFKGTPNSFGLQKAPTWASKPQQSQLPPPGAEEEERKKRALARQRGAFGGGMPAPGGPMAGAAPPKYQYAVPAPTGTPTPNPIIDTTPPPGWQGMELRAATPSDNLSPQVDTEMRRILESHFNQRDEARPRFDPRGDRPHAQTMEINYKDMARQRAMQTEHPHRTMEFNKARDGIRPGDGNPLQRLSGEVPAGGADDYKGARATASKMAASDRLSQEFFDRMKAQAAVPQAAMPDDGSPPIPKGTTDNTEQQNQARENQTRENMRPGMSAEDWTKLTGLPPPPAADESQEASGSAPWRGLAPYKTPMQGAAEFYKRITERGTADQAPPKPGQAPYAVGYRHSPDWSAGYVDSPQAAPPAAGELERENQTRENMRPGMSAEDWTKLTGLPPTPTAAAEAQAPLSAAERYEATVKKRNLPIAAEEEIGNSRRQSVGAAFEALGANNIVTNNLTPEQQARLAAIEAESAKEREDFNANWQQERSRGEHMGVPIDDSRANAMNAQADAMATRNDRAEAYLGGERSSVPYEARLHPGPLAGTAAGFNALAEYEKGKREDADKAAIATDQRFRDNLAESDKEAASRPETGGTYIAADKGDKMRADSARLHAMRSTYRKAGGTMEFQPWARDAYKRGLVSEEAAANLRNNYPGIFDDTGAAPGREGEITPNRPADPASDWDAIEEAKKELRVKPRTNQEKIAGRRAALEKGLEKREAQANSQAQYMAAMNQMAMVPPEQRGEYMKGLAEMQGSMARANIDAQGRKDERKMELDREDKQDTRKLDQEFESFFNSELGPASDTMTAEGFNAYVRNRLQNHVGHIPQKYRDKYLGESSNPIARVSESLPEGASPADVSRRMAEELGAGATAEEVAKKSAALGSQYDLTIQENAEKELIRLAEQYQPRALAASDNYVDRNPKSSYENVMKEMDVNEKHAIETIKKTLGEKRYREIMKDYDPPLSRSRSDTHVNTWWNMFKDGPASLRDLPETLGMGTPEERRKRYEQP